jgi:hypothetical protein
MSTLTRKKTVNDLKSVWYNKSKTASDFIFIYPVVEKEVFMPAHKTLKSTFNQIVYPKSILKKISFIKQKPFKF